MYQRTLMLLSTHREIDPGFEPVACRRSRLACDFMPLNRLQKIPRRPVRYQQAVKLLRPTPIYLM